MRFPEDWPGNLTYRMFEAWFEVGLVEMAWDLGKKPLVAE